MDQIFSPVHCNIIQQTLLSSDPFAPTGTSTGIINLKSLVRDPIASTLMQSDFGFTSSMLATEIRNEASEAVGAQGKKGIKPAPISRCRWLGPTVRYPNKPRPCLLAFVRMSTDWEYACI